MCEAFPQTAPRASTVFPRFGLAKTWKTVGRSLPLMISVQFWWPDLRYPTWNDQSSHI